MEKGVCFKLFLWKRGLENLRKHPPRYSALESVFQKHGSLKFFIKQLLNICKENVENQVKKSAKIAISNQDCWQGYSPGNNLGHFRKKNVAIWFQKFDFRRF